MGVITTQGIKFQLVAEGQILDLFKDEEILLSDNVTGLFDLGIVPADFTRQITLPGSKKNNAFFEHVYDISVQSPDTFATNVKVPCYIDFNGIYLAQGYLQLNKVNVYANKFIDSYEVTIYGAISSFAREINRNFLNDLTSLNVYNHTSSFTNISSSWSGNLFNGDIVYPLAEYGQKLQYTSDVFFGIDDTEGALGVQDFKPAIRVKRVWDAIFQEAGYTYSGSFWEQSWLDDVYLVLNRQLKYPVYNDAELEGFGVATISPISASGQTDLLVAKNTNTVLPWYNIEKNPSNALNGIAYTLPVSSSLRGNLTLNLSLSGSLGAPQINFLVLETGSMSVVSETTLVNFNTYFSDNLNAIFATSTKNGLNDTYEIATPFNTSYIAPGTYYFALKWTDQYGSPYNNFTFILDKGGKPKSKLEITKVLNAADGRILDVPLNMPFGTRGIKQIDFLTGIQKKFNLVIYPSKTQRNQFVVETFNNWYNKGRRWDFNKYINLEEKLEIIPANNFAVNELNFGDTLDQDYISQQFNKLANREFGKTYYVDTENFFSQGKFEVKTSLASSPLIYLTGTGLSGSVAGLNPPTSAIFVGYMQLSTSTNPKAACSNTTTYPIFSSTGTVEPGVVLYFDAAATNPLLNYRIMVRSDYDCSIWTINPNTATLEYDTGDTCTTYGIPCL